jgi:transposase
LFGLPGFDVLDVQETDGELTVRVQTPPQPTGCPGCGAVAVVKDRRWVRVRDLRAAGRPVILWWRKRVWSCRYSLCDIQYWTEQHEAVAPRSVLTERARQWAFEQVARHDATVAAPARDLGVAWGTVMRQVRERGQALLDDPDRTAGPVTAIGVDETAFLRATGAHPTMYATGVADLTPGRPARLIAVIPGRSGTGLGGWLAGRDPTWREGIRTASLDPFRGYATALAQQLPDATRVLDPLHAVQLGLTFIDYVRRRVQQDTYGQRGRTGDPLFGARRRLRRRADRLTQRHRDRLEHALRAGDPSGEVTAAWHVAQQLMAGYAHPDPSAGRAAAEHAIDAARSCPVPEVARLGRTLHRWRPELLAHFQHPGVSNGPTENLNLKIKNTKRAARGYRNFDNYTLRLLLNHGILWQDHQPTRIRTRRPTMVA